MSSSTSSLEFPLLTEDIVTTIYVNGFPDDFKEREFVNLFAFANGFEGCSLRIPSESDPSGSPLLRYFSNVPKGQILGFAKFKTLGDAQEACRILNGRVVDAEKGIMLKSELAKKNLVLGQLRKSNTSFSLPECKETVFGPNLARRASVPSTSRTDQCPSTSTFSYSLPLSTQSTSPSSVPVIQTPRSLSLSIPGQSIPVPIAAPSFTLTENARAGVNLKNMANSTSAPTTPPSTLLTGIPFFTENPPCNTLYVGNLPPNASEFELRALFSQAFGFKRLSFKPKMGGSPMCFVEFEDIKSASGAMETMYGTMLSNSTKGGIRLSFSKNPLGVRSIPPLSSFLGANLYSDLFPEIALKETFQHEFNSYSRFLENPITSNPQ